jgi:translation initiation factor IF-2
MAEKTTDVVKTLMKMGVMANATQSLDADTAELVVTELGHKSTRITDDDL